MFTCKKTKVPFFILNDTKEKQYFFLKCIYNTYHNLQPFIEHNCKGCVNIQVVCSGKKLRLICLLKSSFHCFQSKNQNSKWKSCQKIIVEIEEASGKIIEKLWIVSVSRHLWRKIFPKSAKICWQCRSGNFLQILSDEVTALVSQKR